MKQIVYADNAATTKLDIEAFEAMRFFLTENYANPSQSYSFSRAAKKAIKEARQIIADCINANQEEIFFTSGGSESDNWAIKGTLNCLRSRQGIITSEIEHHAVLKTCQEIEKRNYPVSYIPVTKEGIVLPEVLKQYINTNTNLVSIMYANNEIGTIEPIKELCEISHKNGALFHTDGVQAVGHIKVDVKDLDVDMFSASAHKFNGPKGIGFLYIKKGTPIYSYICGGRQEFGRRAGTENVPYIVAMSIALKNNCNSLSDNAKYLTRLENILISRLKESNIDFIRNGSRNHIPGNISLSFKDKEGEMILHRLDLKGIYVSTGAACNSVDTQVSHVLRAIAVEDEYARGTIRISLSKENNEEEVKYISDSLVSIIRGSC